MLLLGIDLGTSSVKVSVVDAATQVCIASAQYPDNESPILSIQPGWAEQSPDQWWKDVMHAIIKCHASGHYDPMDIKAIGIAYQMHGLVVVDSQQQPLRNAIIWCDSRAVEIGNKAFEAIGEEHCLSHLLNSPGNFTASKLAWIKENEPSTYRKIEKVMLPGDYIAMKLTGDVTTTIPALSEGIFWDFKENSISEDVVDYFGFEHSLFPTIRPLFSPHGQLRDSVASILSLRAGIPVSYKAGDQLNNALSLNVLKPGEVAATAGTSGVIYGVSDDLTHDKQSRINSFAHVNFQVSTTNSAIAPPVDPRIGVLLCINGAGIFNRWIKNIAGTEQNYENLNSMAMQSSPGASGLLALPFGNGAERMLNNQLIGGHFHNLDFNVHTTAHMIRAVQEGIAFAFRYGLDIMRENGMNPAIIRAARTNMFLSNVFANSFVNSTNVALEFFDGDGSFGAAIGAGIGAGIYKDASAAAENRKALNILRPSAAKEYEALYQQWKEVLNSHINKNNEVEPIPFSLS